MPEKRREEKEGRIAYENVVLNLMNKVNFYFSRQMYEDAFCTMQTLYRQLIRRHRDGWLDQVEKQSHNGGRVTPGKARRMLTPMRSDEHYLDPKRKLKQWGEIWMAWADAAHGLGMFFISREIEVGHE